MNKGDFEALAKRVMRFSQADDVSAKLSCKVENLTRFGENRITQNINRTMIRLSVQVGFGSKKGSSETTDLTDEGIKESIKRAETMATQACDDPEYVPPLGPQSYPRVPNRFYDETAFASPVLRAQVVQTMTSRASAAGMQAAGRFATGFESLGWATNRGLSCFHKYSFAEIAMTAMDKDASGYAHQASERLDQISAETAAETAVKKVETGRSPVELSPGTYTVILEPMALADLFVYMLYLMDARPADEQRSFFAGKLGRRIFDERITIVSDPSDPENPAVPFLEGGLPAPRLVIAEQGMLKALFYSLAWARQKGAQPTGRRWFCTVTGDRQSNEDLLKGVERGVLVSRFWYVRYVDPMKVMVTGMTRDGTYLVEDGKIVAPIKNMRFNESVVEVLSGIKSVGKPVRTYMRFCVPPVVVRKFNFASGTLF